MDYVRLYTTLHDDPGMKRLSDKAYRYYVDAMSWCGLHETGGVYEVFGPIPKQVRDLVTAGKFEPTDDPEKFVIHGWDKRQPWEAGAQDRRDKARAAADARWNATGNATGNARSNAKRIALGNAQESKVQESRAKDKELKALATLPRRDELFEALCEACGIEWQSLTSTGRGAANRALAELRGVKATPDEIHRRADNWPSLFDADTTLTPSALAKHWAQLATRRVVHTPTTNLALAMADEMEGR